MSSAEVQEIELNIKEAQKFVDLGKAVEKLQSNRDFKKVVMEGYFEKEAVRLVHAKSDPNMQGEKVQKAIDNDITAIGSFVQYLRQIEYRADMAQKAIEDNEHSLYELNQEDSE